MSSLRILKVLVMWLVLVALVLVAAYLALLPASQRAVEDTRRRIEDARVTNDLVFYCINEAGYTHERCDEWAIQVISKRRETVTACFELHEGNARLYWGCVTAAGISPP